VSYSAIYRARATGYHGSVLDVFVPQIFGDVPVSVTDFVGTAPDTVGMGWVMFQGGDPAFPVWVSDRGGGGGGGGTGPAGPPGPAGPAGPAGSGVTIKGTLAGTSTPLPSSPTAGDMWLLGSPVPTAAPSGASGKNEGDGIVWSGTAWTNVGPIRGPQGATGPQGVTGPGVPVGGTVDQVLTKVDATDFNTKWATRPTATLHRQTGGAANTILANTAYGPFTQAITAVAWPRIMVINFQYYVQIAATGNCTIELADGAGTVLSQAITAAGNLLVGSYTETLAAGAVTTYRITLRAGSATVTVFADGRTNHINIVGIPA